MLGLVWAWVGLAMRPIVVLREQARPAYRKIVTILMNAYSIPQVAIVILSLYDPEQGQVLAIRTVLGPPRSTPLRWCIYSDMIRYSVFRKLPKGARRGRLGLRSRDSSLPLHMTSKRSIAASTHHRSLPHQFHLFLSPKFTRPTLTHPTGWQTSSVQ